MLVEFGYVQGESLNIRTALYFGNWIWGYFCLTKYWSVWYATR